MEHVREKLMELVPATSAYAVTGSGILTLSNLINVVLLALLLVQLAYVGWKWRRDWKRHNKLSKSKKRLEARREQNARNQY